jgi:hypothetical protein
MNQQAYNEQLQLWLKLCINSNYDLFSYNRPFVFYDPDVQEQIKNEGSDLVTKLLT